MGWNRKGKYGIHTGRTLRSCPTRKYCSTNYNSFTKTGQECAVVKELLYASENSSVINIGFDDGIPLTRDTRRVHAGRGYPVLPVIQSMNKHKRWLLPDIIQEQMTGSCVEPCAEPARKTSRKNPKVKHERSDDFRVTVVERHIDPFSSRNSPDCFRVSSCEANGPKNIGLKSRTPTKLHAHVGDLKPKNDGGVTELYYEFLQPYSSNCYPANRELGCRFRYSTCDIVGSKSRGKCKGRNKSYRNGVPQMEELKFVRSDDTSHVSISEVSGENSSNQEHPPRGLFPIGTYINKMINERADKRKDVCSDQPREPKTDKIKCYGKGDAIFVDNSYPNMDSSSSNVEPNEVTELTAFIADEKSTVVLSAKDIEPVNLMHDFADNYLAGGVFPRKFIVNSDVTVENESTECCLLFEIPEIVPGEAAVNAQIVISSPESRILEHSVRKRIETELNGSNGPIAVKTVVSIAVDEIEQVRKLRSEDREEKIQSAKRSVTNDASVEFIHDLCQQKPEVCNVKKALQHSGKKSNVKRQEFVSQRHENTNTTCEICYLDVEVCESGLTRLNDCFHTFCNECWKSYITSCIQSGQSRITCPYYKCESLISEPLVWFATNSELYQTYRKLHEQFSLSSNPALRQCPSPDCANLAYVDPTLTPKSQCSLPIHCECGNVWCFQCQAVAHWPASCEETEVFRKRHGDYEEFKKSLLEDRIRSVMVKRCPYCHYPIDKNMGCSHMSCRCGNDFCWDCLKSWQDHEWPCATKALEEVQLSDVNGNARYRKYCNIALVHLRERYGKKISGFRKIVRKSKVLESGYHDDGTAKCSQLLRTYVKHSISSHIDAILRFKCLAHFVLENTALAIAVGKYKGMVSRLDFTMHTLVFIVGRLEEFILRPATLSDEKTLAKVQGLLRSGKRLIKQIDVLVRANRKPHSLMHV